MADLTICARDSLDGWNQIESIIGPARIVEIAWAPNRYIEMKRMAYFLGDPALGTFEGGWTPTHWREIDG